MDVTGVLSPRPSPGKLLTAASLARSGGLGTEGSGAHLAGAGAASPPAPLGTVPDDSANVAQPQGNGGGLTNTELEPTESRVGFGHSCSTASEPGYVLRDLLVTDSEVGKMLCPEREFLQHEGPLVVLGEPGAGKSRLVAEFARKGLDAPVLSARHVGTEIGAATPPRRIIVDDFGELPSLGHANPMEELLARIPRLAHGNIVVACRTSEWHDHYAEVISRRWNRWPLVGELLPLDEEGRAAFVNAHAKNGRSPGLAAGGKSAGLCAATGNPALLSMLLGLRSSAIPKTKTGLLEKVCEDLAGASHQRGLNGGGNGSVSLDSLLDAAGLVCAHLLLSGTRGVTASGGLPHLPHVDNLLCGGVGGEAAHAALESRLFRSPGRSGIREPRSRRVAEFLAARWIAKSVKRGSLRTVDLDALLHADGGIVPTNCRALHAWIATLGGEASWEMALRDPVGLFCHGDPASLGGHRLEEVLRRLRAALTAEEGQVLRPPCRSVFGRLEIGPKLRDRILEWMADGETGSGFVMLAAASCRGTGAGTAIARRLGEAALTPASANRKACLDALVATGNAKDANMIVARLHGMGDADSLRLAFGALTENIDKIRGELAVNVLVDVDLRLGRWESVSRLIRRFPERVAKEGIHKLERIARSRGDPGRRAVARQWIVPLLEGLVERGAPPRSSWKALLLAVRTRHYDADWDGVSARFFEGQEELRSDILGDCLRLTRAGRLLRTLEDLEDVCPALSLSGDDIRFFLARLVAEKPKDWKRHWRDLVEYGRTTCQIERNDRTVSGQARRIRPLRAILDAVEDSVSRSDKARWFAQAKAAKMANAARKDAQQREFRKAKAELAGGRNLPLLMRAVDAHLHTSASDKLGDGQSAKAIARVAGADMVPSVRKGIGHAAIRLGKGLGVRRLSEVWARHEHNSAGQLLLSHCVMCAENREPFPWLPPRLASPALAAIHLSDWAGDLAGYARARDEIERAVLAAGAKGRYFSGLVSPILAAGEDLPLRAGGLLLRQEHRDVAGDLALEWLCEHPSLSEMSFGHIATMLRTQACGRKVGMVVRERLSAGRVEGDEQRRRLMFVAFSCDFQESCRLLSRLARLDSGAILVFRDALDSAGWTGCWPGLSAEQCHFLVSEFGSAWPGHGSQGEGRASGEPEVEAAELLSWAIRSLAENPSAKAGSLLSGLRNSRGAASRASELRAAADRHRRVAAMAPAQAHSVSEVHSVLSGRPAAPSGRQGAAEPRCRSARLAGESRRAP